MSDPLVQGFLEELKARKASLESDLHDAETIQKELEPQLREVTDVWNRLMGTNTTQEPVAEEPPEPKPKAKYSRGKGVPDEDIRNWIVQQSGTFTRNEMAEAFGLSTSWAGLRLPAFVDKGIVEALPVKANQLRRYRYLKPTEAGAAATMQPKTNGHGNADAGALPVGGTGRGIRAGSKETAPMIAKAKAQGFKVEVRGSGHIAVIDPKNPNLKAIISSSPSDIHAADNGKRDLQRIGVRL